EMRSGAAVRVTSVSDVLYLPEMGLQVMDGTIVPEEGILNPWNLDHEQRIGFRGRAVQYEAPFPVRFVDENVCILSNLYSYNFTHFIEELLKVAILEQSDFTGRYVMYAMPGFAYNFLALMGISRSRIVEVGPEPVIFSTAHYATAVY